jgi:hypothetical protein
MNIGMPSFSVTSPFDFYKESCSISARNNIKFEGNKKYLKN